MRPFGAWFGRLAMAGACLGVAGCGGGDIPDPDSDRLAAQDTGTSIAKGPAPTAPADAPAADAPVKPETDGPAKPASPEGENKPAPSKPNAPGDAEKPAAPAPEAEKPATDPKGDSSGTDELLRMAGTPPQAGGAPAAPAAPSAPGAPAAPSPQPGAVAPGSTAPGAATPGATAPGREDPNRGRPAPGPSTPGPGGSPPAGGGGAAPGAPGAATLGDEGKPAAPSGGGPGFGGMAPAGGGAGASDSASTGNKAYNHPTTAVTAFLAALKAKDKDRLKDFTAVRAATEASEKHQKIFSEIIDMSISDEELEEMSKAMDGYRVISELPAKSTGRIGVLVGKQSGKDYFQRTIMTRKEKEGWRVLDITGMYDFKPGLPPLMNRNRGRRR